MAIATSAQLARALYDNTAESPQELSFRRGDVLRVLRGEGAAGLRGWCLCSLHGRQGIVPANRVELLPAGPAPPARPGSPRPAPQRQEEEREVYVVPPPARPCPPSPDPIYKVPRGHGTQPAAPGEGLEVYDVPSAAPRPRPSSPYDSPASFARPAPGGEDEAPYDVPLAPKPPPELEEGREPGPPFHAAPSNLRRASALLNLYEAPEELLASGDADEGIYEVPLLGPDAPSPEPPAAAAPLLARSPPPARRPRLPSAESLSRRPLPALPVPEPPSPAPARKGSIQDRPLPPPPPRLPVYGAPEADGEPAGPEAEAGPVAPHNEYEGIPTAEEYDYVHLKGVDKTPGPRPPDKASPGDSELPDKGRPEKQETAPPREPPAAGDLQLLRFYAGQCRGHHSALQGAVAALLASTRAGQPPGLFVPLGKQVAVAAHRLVFVGDALGRLAAAARVRAQVGAAGAALGRALRGAVLAVKGAALGYPSSAAAQELARCVADLAGEAQRFTTLLARLAS